MSKQNARRLAALRAMADQNASPEEAAIAAVKLREMETRIAAEPDNLTAWQRTLRREAEQAALQAAADESTRAALVKRWERGTFVGMTIRAGAVTKLVEPSR